MTGSGLFLKYFHKFSQISASIGLKNYTDSYVVYIKKKTSAATFRIISTSVAIVIICRPLFKHVDITEAVRKRYLRFARSDNSVLEEVMTLFSEGNTCWVQERYFPCLKTVLGQVE